MVFFYGGSSSSTQDGKTKFTQTLEGTLIVEQEKREVFRVKMADWAKQMGHVPQENTAAWVVVVVKEK